MDFVVCLNHARPLPSFPKRVAKRVPAQRDGVAPSLHRAPRRRRHVSARRVEASARQKVEPGQEEKVTVAPSPSVPPSAAPGEPSPPPPPEEDGRLAILLDKLASGVSDAITDIGRHVGRQIRQLPTTSVLLDSLEKGGGQKLKFRRKTGKPVVLVLGSGWGAHSCIKVIDTDMYDVLVVSPRNFFVFTPMLPSTAVGTVEFRSLLEPVRTSNEFVDYLEADCNMIDLKEKVATCSSSYALKDGRRPVFEIPYDILVVAVGEQPATFGVPGVKEYCCFMKEISDTRDIRRKIGSAFELASLPDTSEEERRRLLHFVVVGGGPTGVEFAGTLADYLRTDLKRKYPQQMPYVEVSLLQSGDAILTQFDRRLANKALEDLKKEGVNVRTGVRVVQVTDQQVVLKGGERINYSLCVWSAGNAARPLVQSLVDQIEEQGLLQTGPPTTHKLVVDQFLRVVGAEDVLAIGDCSRVSGNPLPATAQVAAQQGAYLAHMMNRAYNIGQGGPGRPGPMRPKQGPLTFLSPGFASPDGSDSRLAYQHQAELVESKTVEVETYRRVFDFLSLGIMAYVGDGKAAIDSQIKTKDDASLAVYGSFAFLLWRSVYITKQVSFRNRVLILFDWLKTRVFGRDLSTF